MEDAGQFMWINKSAASSHLSRCNNLKSAAINSFVQSKLNQACDGRSSKPYRPRAVSSERTRCETLPEENEAAIISTGQAYKPATAVTCQQPRSPDLDGPFDISQPVCGKSAELEKSRLELFNIEIHDLERLEEQSIRNDTNVRDVLGCKFLTSGVDQANGQVFRNFVPLAAQSLGLSVGRYRAYAAAQLYWSLQNDDVFLGLALYYHCHALHSRSSQTFTQGGIAALRANFLQKVDVRLGGGEIDDVLIQVIILAIAIDRFLGLTDFTSAHLKALETSVALRGGLTKVGLSRPCLGNVLSLSAIAALFGARSVCGSNSTDTRRKDIALPKECSRLPEGMQALAKDGYCSTELIKILSASGDCQTGLSLTTQPIWSYAASTSLTCLEMSILIAVVCLQEDLTGEGDCMRMLFWTDSHRFAECLLNQTELWSDNQLSDLLVWLISVIATPKKRELIPFEVQSELQQRFARLHPDIREKGIVEKKLKQFFTLQASLDVWKYAWMVGFQSLK